MLGMLIVLLLCLIMSCIGFTLGKRGKKKCLLIAAVPFICVTVIHIYELHFSGPQGGSPFVIVLYVTLAAPLSICYIACFYVGMEKQR